jgi:hypothetical protein
MIGNHRYLISMKSRDLGKTYHFEEIGKTNNK